jgi:hypothetical protein
VHEGAELDEASYFLTRMKDAQAAHDEPTFKDELSAFSLCWKNGSPVRA